MPSTQSQEEKFKEAARKLGLDESDEALDKAFDKIEPKTGSDKEKEVKQKK